jgi:glycosyltransferase involved in cell wall biosynthesis
MSDPGTSVIIPVRDGAPWIGDLLTALLHQRGADAGEIIVVDNGSGDGTPELVSRYPVRLLVAAQRRGPSAARNAGIQAAQGEWLAFLDADTLPSRRWLAALVGPLADPAVTCTGGKTISYLPTSPAERFMARLPLHAFEFKTGRRLFPFFASRNFACRRSQALAIGGWAEEMTTAEDIDFCTRLRRRFPGEEQFVEDALLFHRDRADDAALRRQAWSYGQGLGHIYRRYPEIARWSPQNSVELMVLQAWRTVGPSLLQVARRGGCAGAEEVTYARYHRLWSDAYWQGFRSMLRTGEQLPPPWEATPMRRTAQSAGA